MASSKFWLLKLGSSALIFQAAQNIMKLTFLAMAQTTMHILYIRKHSMKIYVHVNDCSAKIYELLTSRNDMSYAYSLWVCQNIFNSPTFIALARLYIMAVIWR